MNGMSDDQILSAWQSATDELEGWWHVVGELNSYLDTLREELPEDYTERLDFLQKRIAQIEGEIAELVEQARKGEISQEDLESAFQEKYDELTEIEEELIELESEEEMEIYWDEGEEEEES